VWILAGLVLIVVAALSTSASIEMALLGRATGALAWGPSLFRALLLFHGVCLVAYGAFGARRAVQARPAGNASGASVGLRSSPRVWATLGLLCAVGLALRLWRLDTDLWLDEVLTLTDFLRLPFSEIVATFPSQNQHMLYSLLARGAILIFGESFAAARLPAVLFGVASLWALFMLGRRVAGEREALLSAALMTFSYHHVWFSQNARGYSGLLFFSILSTWLWIEAIGRGKPRLWIAYGAAVGLGLWIHMTMVFVPAAHGIVYLSRLAARESSARAVAAGELDAGWIWKPIVTWLGTATLVLQAHALALPEFLRSALHEVSLESEWVSPMWVLSETVRRLGDGGLASVVVLGALVVAGAGFGSYARRNWRDALLLAVPGLLGGGTMIALGHNLWPRFFFFCMGFVLLITVRGLIVVPEWILGRFSQPAVRRLGVSLGTAICLLGTAVSATTLPRSYLPKQDFSGARQYVEQMRQPGDEVVVVGLAAYAYRRYYAPQWPYVERRADLEAIQERHQGVWLIYTLPVHLKAWVPEIWDAVQRDYEVVRVFPGTLGGGDVIVCRWRGKPRAVPPGGAG
jgi:4-amino-4-deoxy-L-arabinose transferase-like glycosyltransferase